MVINGKEIAERIIEDLSTRPKPIGYFAAFLIGNDPASASFLRQKAKVAERLGIDFRLYELDAASGNDVIRDKVRSIVEHSTCGGALVQLPLPQDLNRHYILNIIPKDKDCDVLSEKALGSFYAGRNQVLPPVAETVKEILKSVDISLENKKVAVIGTGLLIGRPISVWLMNQVKEIFVLHKGSDLNLLKNADIVITGTGSANLINADMLKDGAAVIDFGYGKGSDGVCGDFNPVDSEKLFFYTPTPGGTGPILVAKLFENFYKLNEKGTQ